MLRRPPRQTNGFGSDDLPDLAPPLTNALPAGAEDNIFGTGFSEDDDDYLRDVIANLPSNDAPTREPQPEELVEEAPEDQEEYRCCVCLMNKVNALFPACVHASFCYACAKRIERDSGECPLCRQRSERVTRLFFNK